MCHQEKIRRDFPKAPTTSPYFISSAHIFCFLCNKEGTARATTIDPSSSPPDPMEHLEWCSAHGSEVAGWGCIIFLSLKLFLSTHKCALSPPSWPHSQLPFVTLLPFMERLLKELSVMIASNFSPLISLELTPI